MKKRRKENIFYGRNSLCILVILFFCAAFLGGCAKTDRVIWSSDMETEEVSVESGRLGETEQTRAVNASSSLGTENAEALDSFTTKEVVIYVYVCGEVNNPGVVTLPEGSRADDALKAAGGFTENAQQSAVNLAALLEDGQQLYFPSKEEEIEQEEDGLINLNTADEALLCTLPGIGASRAKDIIAYREENNGFASIEDIMKVPGIKEASYEKIKNLITIK